MPIKFAHCNRGFTVLFFLLYLLHSVARKSNSYSMYLVESEELTFIKSAAAFHKSTSSFPYLSGGFVHTAEGAIGSIPSPDLKTTGTPPTASNFQSRNIGFIRTFVQLVTSTECFFNNLVSGIITDPDLVALFARICSYTFWIYCSMCILGTIGIDIKPVLTSLNVALITLGFAAQGIITSFFAGMYILFTKPFQRGSVITVNGLKGKVISIDIRYVKLSSVDKRQTILIPSSVIFGNSIILDDEDQSLYP